MKRREFSRAVKVEILRRAQVPGTPLFRCEGCGSMVASGEIHHLDQDAMQTEKSTKLTAKDGQFLCRGCHKEITVAQAPVLAKVKRIEAKHWGARKAPTIPGRGFQKKARTHADRPPATGMSELSRRMKENGNGRAV